ncbi:MAG: head GIN domain-containing protein [Chryseolinea sp.]
MKKQFLTLVFAAMIGNALLFAQNRQTRNVDTFTKISFRVPGTVHLRQGSPQKVEVEGKSDVLKALEIKVEGNKLIIGNEKMWSWKWRDDDKVTVYITVANIEGLAVSGSGDIIGETKISSKSLDLNVSGSGNMNIEADASGEMDADVSGSGNLTVKGSCRSFSSNVSGSGKVELALKISEDADFGISGSGKIQASGSAAKVKATISGSGKVLAANLETNDCEVRISGSGDVQINVKESIDANITGSGSVSYRGNPSKINSHSSGSGSVRKM